MESKLRMWESLRNDARQADNDLESKLTELEVVGRRESLNSDTEAAYNTIVRDVDASLRGLEAIVNSMSDIAQALSGAPMPAGQAESGTPSVAAMGRHTERFKELTLEKRKTLKRLTDDFRRRREREQLLPKVHDELLMFNAERENANIHLLAREQESIDFTTRRLNGLLDEAATTQDRLRAQRQRFLSMSDKVVQIVERVPVINSVLRHIDARRRRETVIVGLTICVALLLVFLFW